jgi:hypothetical protein
VDSQRRIWNVFTTDWKFILVLWLPLFAIAMWFGFSRQYEDLGLFAVAMALGIWGLCGRAVFLWRKLREYRLKSRGNDSLQ